MSFKIPRLEFPKRTADLSQDFPFFPFRSNSEEKSSSQLTNTSLFSRDEFEDSSSQSQLDDSQCFWTSLRKICNPEDSVDDHADLNSQDDYIVTDCTLNQELGSIIREIEKIGVALEQSIERAIPGGKNSDLRVRFHQSFSELHGSIRKLSEVYNEKCLEINELLGKISDSQSMLKHELRTMNDQLNKLQSIPYRRCHGIDEKYEKVKSILSPMLSTFGRCTPIELKSTNKPSQPHTDLTTHARPTSFNDLHTRKNYRDIKQPWRQCPQKGFGFSHESMEISKPLIHPADTTPSFRMTFSRTPKVETRKNLRQVTGSFMNRLPSLREDRTAQSNHGLDQSTFISNKWNNTPFKDIFEPSSPTASDQSSPSDCISISSLMDIC